MVRGIGVRYSDKGLRALMIEPSENGLSIIAVAAGPADGDVYAFLDRHGFDIGDAGIAVGLGPGDFLSACMPRGKSMDDLEVEEQLRWELERKMVSAWPRHSINFALAGNSAFMFAARKDLVDVFRNQEGKPPVVDVEPFALFNGCEGAGEIIEGPAILVSAEADGISGILVENGAPLAVESYSLQHAEPFGTLPESGFTSAAWQNRTVADRFTEQIADSVSRLITRGKNGGAFHPERLVLAGAGARIDGLARMAEDRTGMPVVVSDPFTSLKVDMAAENTQFSELGPVFTTCFGLALRATEE